MFSHQGPGKNLRKASTINQTEQVQRGRVVSILFIFHPMKNSHYTHNKANLNYLIYRYRSTLDYSLIY